jgi:hypothetical protein
MKAYAIAGLLLIASVMPSLAAENSAQHYAVIDTVGNCAVVDTKPSPHDISGLKILGDKSGYSSVDAATQALKSDSGQCKGTIDRA